MRWRSCVEWRTVTDHLDRIASYLQRYDILCRKLMMENLYSYACVVTTRRDVGHQGIHGDMGQMTSLHSFATTFASYAAAEALR